MNHQQAIHHLQKQYSQLVDECERWARFTTDPIFARQLYEQAALYRQFLNELSSAATTSCQELKATVKRLAAIYLQRDDAMVAGEYYRALTPLITYYQGLLNNTALPGNLRQLVSRQYTLLNEEASTLRRMMTF